MTNHGVGVDVGTTAIKVAVIELDTSTVVFSTSKTHNAYVLLPERPYWKEQSVPVLLTSIISCLREIPAKYNASLTDFAVTGQMHGIVWWRAENLKSAVLGLFDHHEHHSLDGWNDTWTRLITWEDRRCSREHLAPLNDFVPVPAQKISTGYGIASFWHTIHHHSEERGGSFSSAPLASYDCCGTIQDLVVFAFCGFSQSKDNCMDVTNACSWGAFSLNECTWNQPLLEKWGFKREHLDMLPKIKQSGLALGTMNSEISTACYFGKECFPKVGVAMGDHPCSVAACIAFDNGKQTRENPLDYSFVGSSCAVLNMGTSTQLTMFSPQLMNKIRQENNSNKANQAGIEVRPYFTGENMLVSASMSGGNIFASFVQTVRGWYENVEILALPRQSSLADDAIYARLIELGLERANTSLELFPRFIPERYEHALSSGIKASVQSMDCTNISLGDISASLCRGIVDHILQHLPPDVERIICTGNTLRRNELLFSMVKSCSYAENLREFSLQSDDESGGAAGAIFVMTSTATN